MSTPSAWVLLPNIALSLPNLGVLAAAGLACGYSLLQFGRALLARRWPTTEGEIVDARVVHMSGGESRKTLDRVVTYRYQVAGQRYSNNRVRFGLQLTPSSIVPASDASPNVVASMTAGYSRGKPVRVFYNPRRPEDSVLYPTPNVRVWIILAAGLYFGHAAVHGAF